MGIPKAAIDSVNKNKVWNYLLRWKCVKMQKKKFPGCVWGTIVVEFFCYMLYDFDVSIEGWVEKPLNDASWQGIQITKSSIAQGVQSVSKYFWIFR